MEKNLFVEKYLERINFHEEIAIDLCTLKKLHKQHLLTVPFENLDIFLDRRIEMDFYHFWEKIVEKRRGGLCYEVNGLFFSVLKEIGFNVRLISAKVLEDGGIYDHAFILASLDDEPWLADVGFGDSFHEPIKFSIGEVQEDDNRWFKIEKNGEDEYRLLRSMNGVEYALEYIFSLKERKLSEFEERCTYFQTSSDSRFRKNRICSIERENGRVCLKDDKLIITDKGTQTITKIEREEEFVNYLKELFNIDYGVS